jgi:hypothetical protein
VSRLLLGVIALSQTVVAERTAWTASGDQWDFLLEVSSVTEHPVPPSSKSDASAALGFLLKVRLSLEATLQTLGETPESS